MQGSLGIGANLDHWQEADFATARTWIAAYKSIRDIVQRGDLYRIAPPRSDAASSATFHVSPDKRRAVLFQMLHSSSFRDNVEALHPEGLDPLRSYRVRIEHTAGADLGWLYNHAEIISREEPDDEGQTLEVRVDPRYTHAFTDRVGPRIQYRDRSAARISFQ